MTPGGVKTVLDRLGNVRADRLIYLAIVSLLAVVFSLGALLMLGQSAVTGASDSPVSGVVRSCVGEDTRAPVCNVEITSPAAHAGVVKVDRAGPFDGLAPGRPTSLWLSGDGSAEVAGWHGWANGLSLAFAALVVLAVALSAWAPILRTPTPED